MLSSRSGLRRRAVALMLAVVTPAVTTVGCYTTRPVLGPPAAGTRVVLTLNDRGRVALNDSLGTDVDRVEGRVAERTDSSLLLAVTRVRTFGGQETAWTGERVQFRTSSLRAITERQPARGRTIAAVVLGAAAAMALILSRSITGGGSGTNPPDPGTTPPVGS